MDPEAKSPLRVGVFGAGSVGCYIGGMLAASGVDVAFVARERLRQDIAAHGLTLRDLDGTTTVLPKERVRIATDASVLADRDIAFCCVKNAQTEEAGAALAAVLPQGAIVISLQNGVHNPEVLRGKLPRRIVLGGIVGFNVVPKQRGEFLRATTGPIAIEAAPDPRVATLADQLTRCGFETKLTHDILAMQWTKLIINLANAVSGLSGTPTRDILLSATFRRTLAALMREALDTLDAAGIKLARLGPLPARFFPLLLRLPTPLFRAGAHAQLRVDPEARSSMYDDLVRGRATEVNYLNGEIVALAEKNGRDASLNRRIVELVHQAEAKGASPHLSAEALWGALVKP